MAGSHAPFVLVNRAINPLVRGLLRLPAHGLVSSHLALLTVTGRRSGRADGPERSGRATARAVLASDELAITIQDRSHAIAVVVGHRVVVRQRLQRL